MKGVLKIGRNYIYRKKEVGEGYNNRTFEALLNSAVFSKDVEGVSEKLCHYQTS